jgi:hypothetical protein
MKFLQKETDQPNREPQQGVPKKKRKKDHAHNKEGEISAFFTSVRPPLAEKDGNVSINKVLQAGGGIAATGPRERENSTKSSGVVPTTEMPAKGSYLGYGGRGSRHESTSYVSWSESVQAPDMAPQRPKHLPVTDYDRSKYFKHQQVGSNPRGAYSTEYKRPAPPVVKRGETSIERFQISSVPPSQQRMIRSHSYPQHTSSSRKVNLVDRAAKFKPTESVASPSSMSSHAPYRASVESQWLEPRVKTRFEDHEETAHSAVDNTLSHQQNYTGVDPDIHDAERETSSDLGIDIERCNHKFREQRQATESRGRHPTHHPSNTCPIGSVGIHRRPTVRFSGVEMPPLRIPNFPGASIYEQQAQREQVPLQTVLDEECSIEGSFLGAQELTYQQDGMMYNEQNWDEHFEGPWSGGVAPEASIFGLDESRVPDSMVRRLLPEDSVVAPGFWRPNRLY